MHLVSVILDSEVNDNKNEPLFEGDTVILIKEYNAENHKLRKGHFLYNIKLLPESKEITCKKGSSFVKIKACDVIKA